MSHLVRATAALAVLALAVPAGRRGGQETEAHDDGAHGQRAAEDARRRTSAASAARASRRRRSARAARAGRPSSGSARSRRTATAARGPCSRSCASSRRRSRPDGSGRARGHAGRDPDARRADADADAHADPGAARVPAHAAAQQRRRVQVRRRRLDRQLRRHHALQDRPRPAARARPTRSDVASRGTEDKGTVTVSSGDNFLAGLNLRASFQRFDSGPGRSTTRDAIGRARLRRGHDRQPRVRLRPGPPGAVHRRRAQRRPVPDGQHRLHAASRCCRRCATTGGSPTRPSSRRAAS